MKKLQDSMPNLTKKTKNTKQSLMKMMVLPDIENRFYPYR